MSNTDESQSDTPGLPPIRRAGLLGHIKSKVNYITAIVLPSGKCTGAKMTCIYAQAKAWEKMKRKLLHLVRYRESTKL